MSRKLIIFDFDGTLVDSRGHFAAALHEFSEARGLPYDEEKAMHNYVDPDRLDLGWGIPLHEQRAMMNLYCDYIETQTIEHGRFIPDLFSGVSDMLAELSKDYELGLITMRDRKTTMITLDFYGMRPLFPSYRTHCCMKERCYGIKPSPDSLFCLIKDTGHTPDEVVMIGDTTADIEMAHAAKAKSIAVSWGLQSLERVRQSNPDKIVDKILDLPEAVKNLFNQ